ncbi:MAG: DNA translocase FtsK [Bacteroidales bacterium]|nr:DNA translocase FtsK [Candidatus Cryptobacteroides aphodequi]
MKRLTDEQKSLAGKITGLLVAAFAIFTFTGIVSYLLHWQEDMSGQDIAGAAGTLGARFGEFLVCDCFGLGSLAFLIILVAIASKLLLGRWSAGLIRTTVLAVTGAMLCSFILAFVGTLLKLLYLFGGGLGGKLGTLVTDWASGLVGSIVTGVILLILTVVWLCFCSKRFTAWLVSLGKSKKEEEPVEEPVTESLAAEAAVIDQATEPATAEDAPAVEDTPSAESAPEAAQDAPAAAEGAPEAGLEIVDDGGVDTAVQKELPRIDNRLDPPDGLPKYKFPSLDLLGTYEHLRVEVSPVELTKNKNKICATLANYKIQVAEVKAIVGPTVTLYKVYPAPGVKIAAIRTLQDDIAMSLGAKGVRVVTLTDSVGIEVANEKPSIVPLRGLLNDDSFRESKADLPIAIGYTITQKVKVFDLADAPHLLIAGATKQGKSVGLNVIIASLLYSRHPSELKFVFIDPKMVESSAYSQLLKHYLAVLPEAGSEEDEKERAIVKKAADAEKILRSLCDEMDNRYELMSKAGVNKITIYNDRYKDHKLNPQNGHKFLPYIVVIVDEYADLTMSLGGSAESRNSSRSIQTSIIRLAQKGRAAGMHVILATQRPSVDVINGLIKSNFPMRIAFRTSSRIDSTTIIDAPGAEKLIGKGDMLFSAGIESERIQCGYIDGTEIDAITEFIGSQTGWGRCYNTPYYLPEPKCEDGGASGGATDMGDLDERFQEAARLVVANQKASTSYLQTRLAMGFAKAARVMGQLEAAGIVGPQEGAKPREVLIHDNESLDELLSNL